MIVLHRLGHDDEPFHLNPDLFQTIEETPDTVITLTTAQKVVVSEAPDEVVARIRTWRVGILSDALASRRPSPLHEV
jgi:flagellar protein FlbD